MLNGTEIEIANYLAQHSLVAELNPEQLASLIGQLEQLKAIAWARLVSIPTTTKGAKPEPIADRLLTIAEAATLLRKTPEYIYRNKARLPFVKRIALRSYICSEAEIHRWLAHRKV